jgi:DNA-binding response OmpR family regulator
MKILIVDDDTSSTVTLKALLMSQDNFEIDISNSGRDGLAKMLAGNYDLLILDIMMPDFSGLDLCREINKEEKIKNIPIILASALPISALELKDMLDEFRSLVSVKGVLEKPFVMESLLGEIENAVKK